MSVTDWLLILVGVALLWLLPLDLRLRALRLEVAVLAETVHAIKSYLRQAGSGPVKNPGNLADRFEAEVEHRNELRNGGVVRKPLGGIGG